MLKFSGFSDLTSCLGWREMLHRQGEEWEPNPQRSATQKTNELSFKLLVVVAPQFIERVSGSLLRGNALARRRAKHAGMRETQRGS